MRATILLKKTTRDINWEERSQSSFIYTWYDSDINGHKFRRENPIPDLKKKKPFSNLKNIKLTQKISRHPIYK